ncbi:hypothetical protein D3C75_886820 [compost metagenome]
MIYFTIHSFSGNYTKWWICVVSSKKTCLIDRFNTVFFSNRTSFYFCTAWLTGSVFPLASPCPPPNRFNTTTPTTISAIPIALPALIFSFQTVWTVLFQATRSPVLADASDGSVYTAGFKRNQLPFGESSIVFIFSSENSCHTTSVFSSCSLLKKRKACSATDLLPMVNTAAFS